MFASNNFAITVVHGNGIGSINSNVPLLTVGMHAPKGYSSCSVCVSVFYHEIGYLPRLYVEN
jgi:hypothetical protein